MKYNLNILRITRTAVFVALLVVLQAATAPLGSTIVTGSLVNFMLIVSVMTCGLYPGLCVAAISPVIAKLIGIGPLWSLIPFIITGNTALVLIWHYTGNRNMKSKHAARITALICAATGKFFVLYVGIVKVALPLLLSLPDKQAQAISGMFSIPQLITALLGGALAFILLPRLTKIITNDTK